MPFGPSLEKEKEVPAANGEAQQECDAPGNGEKFQGAIHGINFEHGDQGTSQIDLDAGKQPRLPQFFVGPDRDMLNSQVLFSCADYGFMV